MPSASPEPLSSQVTCVDEFQGVVMSRTISKMEDDSPICLDSDGEAEECRMDIDSSDADADEEDNMGDQEDEEEEGLCRRYVQ